jgi:hypothetical protein
MVVTEDECLYAFGQNLEGQLGTGPETGIQSAQPVKVPLEEVESVVLGGGKCSQGRGRGKSLGVQQGRPAGTRTNETTSGQPPPRKPRAFQI